MKFPKISTALDDIRQTLEGHAVVLSQARNKYLAKEAERKHFESRLIRSAHGKSISERTIEAQATDEWRDFHIELARLESIFEFQKLKYELLDKEWLAQYLTIKLDDGLIKKQVG